MAATDGTSSAVPAAELAASTAAAVCRRRKAAGGDAASSRVACSSLDAQTISIEKHLFACAPPPVSGEVRPFEIDVSIVCDLAVLRDDGRGEFPIDESVSLISDSGVSVPCTLPPKRPRYVVGASRDRPAELTFFPWERRARRADAIAGKQAFEHGAQPEGLSRWCRSAVDPSLVQLEEPRGSELRMTLLRVTRVVAASAGT